MYKTNSNYADTDINYKYLDIWEPPLSLQKTGREYKHVILSKHANRPDLLAHELYGSSRLWWTFAYLNPDKLDDPIWDFVSGLEIEVYNPSDLRRG